MLETLKPVNHRLRQETALFGIEPLLGHQGLRKAWERLLWDAKNLSEAPYGEATPEDLIRTTAIETGLRPPARGSALRKFVMEEATIICQFEEEKLRERFKMVGEDKLLVGEDEDDWLDDEDEAVSSGDDYGPFQEMPPRKILYGEELEEEVRRDVARGEALAAFIKAMTPDSSFEQARRRYQEQQSRQQEIE